MHEQSLMADLMRKLTDITRTHRARRITAVRVKLGVLSHISPEHFREHFARAVRGTVAEGCRLDIAAPTDLRDSHAQDIVLESVDLERAEGDAPEVSQAGDRPAGFNHISKS